MKITVDLEWQARELSPPYSKLLLGGEIVVAMAYVSGDDDDVNGGCWEFMSNTLLGLENAFKEYETEEECKRACVESVVKRIGVMAHTPG